MLHFPTFANSQCTLLATLAYRVLHFPTFANSQCTLAVYFTGNAGLQGVTFPDVCQQPVYFGSVLYWQRWLTGCYISRRLPTANVLWQCTLLATLGYRVLHFPTFANIQCTLAVYFTGNVGLQGVTFPDVCQQPMYFGSVLYWQRWLTGCYISRRLPTANVLWQCTLLATLAYRVLHFPTFANSQCTLAVYFTGNVGLQGITFTDLFLQPMYFGSVLYRCRQTFRQSRLQNVTCPNVFLLRIRYCGSVPGGCVKTSLAIVC